MIYDDLTTCEARLEWMQPCHMRPKLIGYCRKEAKWVASLDPKATPDEKDAIKKAIW